MPTTTVETQPTTAAAGAAAGSSRAAHRPSPIVIPPTPYTDFYIAAFRHDASDEVYKLLRDLFIIYEMLRQGVDQAEGGNATALRALQYSYTDALRDTTQVLSTLDAVQRAVARLNSIMMASRTQRGFGAGDLLGPERLQRLVQRNLAHIRTLHAFKASCGMFLDVAESLVHEDSPQEHHDLLYLINELGPAVDLVVTLVREKLAFLYRLEGFEGVDTFDPPTPLEGTESPPCAMHEE